MIIHFKNRQNLLRLSRKRAFRVVEGLSLFLRTSCEEIGLHFVSKEEISRLHGQFFGDWSATDCISFPIDSSYLGDLFICPEIALEFTQKREGRDPYRETLLYLVHGYLHLIGYSDQDPFSRKTMRKMEKKCMDHLNKLGFSL